MAERIREPEIKSRQTSKIVAVLNLDAALSDKTDARGRQLTERQLKSRRKHARVLNDQLRNDGVQIFDQDHFDPSQ